MAALWAHVVYSVWSDYGLFYYLGGDFGIYRSIAQAMRAEGPRALYDLDLVAPYARDLAPYYGPFAHGLNLGPGPYPAIYIIPFIALSTVSPPVGFAIWTALCFALALAAVRGMTERLPQRGWGLTASAILFFPVGFALFFGQLTMLLLYGFYRAYRALEGGHDFRAGLWSGALWLKPQYAVFVFLVLLFKLRWRALTGLAVAGAIILLGSVGIAGVHGMRAYFATFRSMSGFRDVMPIVSPKIMMNWRGLLASFLPEDVADETGQVVTGVLSIATVATLLLIWRGEWNPRGDRFPSQMLATVIVMMLASYHNHIHSGALLLVPGLALAARRDNPRVLRALLLAALYLPLPVFFATGSTRRVAWLLIALMLGALAIIVRAELFALLRRQPDRSVHTSLSAHEPAPRTGEAVVAT
jgi:hypothetical protein